MHTVDGGCVQIEYIVVGMLANNVYIVSDGKSVFVVDPGCCADKIIGALGGRKLDAIFVTHDHFDHVGALRELHDATGAPVIASAVDAPVIEGRVPAPSDGKELVPCPVESRVGDGDIVRIKDMAWKAIATPGHTPGSLCLFIDPQFGSNPAGAPVLLSGDTLFCASIGRTDFEGGSMESMRRSLKRLALLPDETIVLPGHNETTTIRAERRRVFAQFA